MNHLEPLFDFRPRTDIARMLNVSPSYLSPGRLVPRSAAYQTLTDIMAYLRGETENVSMDVLGVVDLLDGDSEYSVPELARHMRLWGMETADDWLVKLHQAGAAEYFAVGGWAEVRRWARAIVMEGK